MARFHPVTTPEAALIVLRYYNDALLHWIVPDEHPEPDPAGICACLPQGSISSAVVRWDGFSPHPQIAFHIGDRNPRYIDPEGFLVLRALTLFGGFPSIVADRKKGSPGELHYVVVFEQNLALHRLLADTGADADTRLIEDHHDLRLSNMMHSASKTGGRSPWRVRETAIRLALGRCDLNWEKWALAITRPDYEALLRGSFKLLDAARGYHLCRTVPEPEPLPALVALDVLGSC
ncbi:hypothetical protein [Labrys wisconsinensis]|uniref:Uncharacterized protein n=1 Tax=Labrys wisconsinensis TaxID=425677 RepID=A0ABU0JLT2_9HYPH|nr:hypothetical protein [Labrys wisconsinensis]MDQ0475242.1 hypothetical protein [Labrys wisconsinensis]